MIPRSRTPFRDLRWWLADWLSWLAVKLRGQRWYVGHVWHGVPGNRASELNHRILQNVVCLATRADKENAGIEVEEIETDLTELAQAAGEAWGHIWPHESETKSKIGDRKS